MVDCFDKGDILQPVRPVTMLDAEDPNGHVVGLALIRELNELLSGGLDLAIAVQEIADRPPSSTPRSAGHQGIRRVDLRRSVSPLAPRQHSPTPQHSSAVWSTRPSPWWATSPAKPSPMTAP